MLAVVAVQVAAVVKFVQILQTDPVMYIKFVAKVVRQHKRQGDLKHVQLLAKDHVQNKQSRMFEKRM